MLNEVILFADLITFIAIVCYLLERSINKVIKNYWACKATHYHLQSMIDKGRSPFNAPPKGEPEDAAGKL